MSSQDSINDRQCYFFKFGLLVTGETEAEHLPKLFRSLMGLGICSFEVIRKVEQLGLRISNKKLKVVGTDKKIPDRDAERIGFPAREYLNAPCTYVILLDDLEHDRASQAQQIFERYRKIFDTILSNNKYRASVHFLVNMLEAYYFADADTVNAVLGTSLQDYERDVETIRHPKNDIKNIYFGFDEKVHGGLILKNIDVEKVLSNPDTCASLRTLFAWCLKALMMETSTDKYQLLSGKLSDITKAQLDNL
ncbi:MAG: DUF4276 family protein [Oscillatoriaceae cyanobacterium Prado104]|jgi:hypothetical protein|nr:DUF4276 family protein [Oscillatoriaceae cyanobacterium Prado104]